MTKVEFPRNHIILSKTKGDTLLLLEVLIRENTRVPIAQSSSNGFILIFSHHSNGKVACGVTTSPSKRRCLRICTLFLLTWFLLGKTAVYSAEPGNNSASAVGDAIAYTNSITNNGGLTLWSAMPADSKVIKSICSRKL